MLDRFIKQITQVNFNSSIQCFQLFYGRCLYDNISNIFTLKRTDNDDDDDDDVDDDDDDDNDDCGDGGSQNGDDEVEWWYLPVDQQYCLGWHGLWGSQPIRVSVHCFLT